MYCKQCGHHLPEGAKFCVNCGAQQEPTEREEAPFGEAPELTESPWEPSAARDPYRQEETPPAEPKAETARGTGETNASGQPNNGSYQSYQSAYGPPNQGARWTPPGYTGQPAPPSWLGWNIFVTLCCCQPLGIAGIVCSALSKSRYQEGNHYEANRMSSIARTLFIVGLCLGVLLYLVSFFLYAAY